MRNLAIISARSGSKGLPDKNIRILLGKPLMAYSIEAAIASGVFDEVMVSTDSEKYAEIARSYGANVPFLRSEATSSDTASSWDMVEEVLSNYKNILGREFDTFCLLQPTSPLRTAEDIRAAYKLYQERDAIAVLSMAELNHPIEWCGKIDESLSLDGFHKKLTDSRRQDMGKTFRPNGAIYIVSVDEFRKDRFLYREGSYAYIMPVKRSVDVDSEDDFKRIEYILEENSELENLLIQQSAQCKKQNEKVDLENFFLLPSDGVSTELLFFLEKYTEQLCGQYDVGLFRLNSYQAFLFQYISQIIELGIHTEIEQKLVRYYQKAYKVWKSAYVSQKEFFEFINGEDSRDNGKEDDRDCEEDNINDRVSGKDSHEDCKIRAVLLDDLQLIRDVLLQEEPIGVLNFYFIFQLQKFSSKICMLHGECLDYYFNYKLIVDLINREIDTTEAKKRLHEWEKAKLTGRLIADAMKLKTPSFNIKGHYVPNEKKKLIYLDTNAIINVEKNEQSEKAKNVGYKRSLILKSKKNFDYYYSPSHVEDIQKRDSTVEPRESFLNLINEITDSIEIHRVGECVGFDYEDVYSCNRRVENSLSLDITKTIEDIRLQNISELSLFHPQYASERHRNTINNKDLFGKDRTLLEDALKAVRAPFKLDEVKGIFSSTIPYIKLNDIVYHFIYAFDVLQYWAEKKNEQGKIRSAVHDIEHIIYACYSDFFVTADNRLYHRAKGILDWIAPHVKTLQKSEFYDMIGNISTAITVTFDTNTYQRVLEPKQTDPKYSVAAKIHQLIVDKKIQGFLSETIFTLEAVQTGRPRVAFFANYDPPIKITISAIEQDGSQTELLDKTEGGTTQMPQHGNNPHFSKYWNIAKSLGFKLITCPRIAGVKDPTFTREDYASHPSDWNEVFGACARNIENHGCGKRCIEAIGNQYKQDGETWFEGLKHILASNLTDKINEASEAIAEWADADSIAACVGYGIQYFCTEDQGRVAGSNSILHQNNRQWFNNQNYNLKIVTMDELVTAIENQGGGQ